MSRVRFRQTCGWQPRIWIQVLDVFTSPCPLITDPLLIDALLSFVPQYTVTFAWRDGRSRNETRCEQKTHALPWPYAQVQLIEEGVTTAGNRIKIHDARYNSIWIVTWNAQPVGAPPRIIRTAKAVVVLLEKLALLVGNNLDSLEVL